MSEGGTFPHDPDLDPYNREQKLRRDMTASLTDIKDRIEALTMTPQIRIILQRVEGLLLRARRQHGNN